MTIHSRVPRADYDATPGMNISRLKEIRRSPLHYRHALALPRKTDALTLGIASHVATLEPERFDSDFAIWQRRTEAGKMAPRSGQYWQGFCDDNAGKSILTPDEAATAAGIAVAVRGNALAMKYLATGEPEVTLTWDLAERPCKGRVDWITYIDGEPVIVGLKTARDCRHFVFGAQAAKLGYHLAWGWYSDGYTAATGKHARSVEIVVESAPPHAVAVYVIPPDIIDQGRDEYQACLNRLAECEASGEWPGPVPQEEWLTLPSWAYQAEDDDITDLGLEVTP
jgi:exodeoxyribonuclease VIII